MPELNITASGKNLNALRPLVAADDTDADIISFYTSEERYGGVSGTAYTYAVCGANDVKHHIIEWRKAMPTNAEVSRIPQPDL